MLTESRLLKGIATAGLIISAVLGGLHLHTNAKLDDALAIADAVCEQIDRAEGELNDGS